jgi:Protein of unknown function (DUF2530)
MAKRPRYDRIEPWRPPQPAEPERPERRSRSHAKPASDPGGAPAELLDVDGVAVITVGTVLWAVALIALLPFRDRLADHGLEWWLWTCIAGVGLGLWGIYYCRRRRDRLAAARRSSSEAAPGTQPKSSSG